MILGKFLAAGGRQLCFIDPIPFSVRRLTFSFSNAGCISGVSVFDILWCKELLMFVYYHTLACFDIFVVLFEVPGTELRMQLASLVSPYFYHQLFLPSRMIRMTLYSTCNFISVCLLKPVETMTLTAGIIIQLIRFPEPIIFWTALRLSQKWSRNLGPACTNANVLCVDFLPINV